MSFAIADRVRETTNTTGTTSPLALLGAWPQFQAFSTGVGSGNNCEYTLLSGDGAGWEVGIGTATSGTPNTLSRDTVLASSNVVSGVPQLISLTGTSTVFLTRSAASYRATQGAPIVPPPVAASWTKRFFSGSATLTDGATGPVIADTTTSATDFIEIATLTPPSTPYTIDAKLNFNGCSLGGQESSPALGWTDGTKLQVLEWAIATTSNIFRVNVNNWTNTTTFSGGVVAIDVPWSPTALFGRVADNGTNVTFSMSNDGVNFTQIYTVAKSSGFLGSSGYSLIGFGLEPFANAGANSPASAYVALNSWWQH